MTTTNPRRTNTALSKKQTTHDKTSYKNNFSNPVTSSVASSLHRSMFKKTTNASVTKNSNRLKISLINKFASPTDRLLSPCSQKLTNHKSKFLLAKSNPTKLNFAAMMNKKENEMDSDDE